MHSDTLLKPDVLKQVYSRDTYTDVHSDMLLTMCGLLTGLMPCGALTVMWMFAAASGSWRSGAASMFAFGLGTCVLMITFGMFGKFIPKRYNKYITRVSTVLIVTLGLLLMTKGLKLL